MNGELVDKLSSQTLLDVLTNIEGATRSQSVVFGEATISRSVRSVLMQDELLRRLNLQRDLSLEAQHTVAHIETFVNDHPEFAEELEHAISQLRRLAKTPFGNYLG